MAPWAKAPDPATVRAPILIELISDATDWKPIAMAF
ncbi:hypothetical protein X769_16235 [Mesorhizobium sp. LSJC268A00]|nr:hypothetical protein X769_16235 [Mesorhizobium sp. LSJC268A00]